MPPFQEVSLENLPDATRGRGTRFARAVSVGIHAGGGVSKDLPPLILRPKRLPSVDYSNVALLQLAIRSLQLHAIRDIAVESDAFCLDGHYRVSTLSMRIYMAECLMR